ncbi:MAG: hypothetical protein U9R44_02230 [Candidatus Omnitrophota bacterium]|nr:hypothetical protein [Candidatus Omnitrophota bacterium]
MFGIHAEEMRKKPGKGGLALKEKIRLITAGYEAALGREAGLKAFKDTIAAVETIFGIDAEDMRKKSEQGGLALKEKIRLITAAYHVALDKEAGLKTFKDTIAAIEEIFGIDAEDMRKKPGKGGLPLEEKIRLITAAYNVASGREAGLKTFKDTIAAIEEIFGIDAEDMRKKPGEGGLAWGGKIRLITAGYEAAKGKEAGLTTFKDTIAAIEEIFGIDAEDMRKKPGKGGLALEEKLILITAAYEVTLAKNGLKKLVKEGSNHTQKSLGAMSLAEKISLIMKISSRIIYSGIHETEILSGLIGKYQPLEAINFAYDPELEKYTAVFKAVNIETDQEEVITLHAERAPPGTFEKYRETGIPEIDKKLAQTLQEIPRKSRFILELNSYGIDGLGTEDMLAIVRPLENNEIALFHELAHSSGIDVTPHINGGEKALDDYINKKGKEHRKVPEMRPHYALRLFQKQKWPVKDGALSKTISILDYVTSEMDEKKRSYILAEEHVHERFGLFAEVFTELGEELHIDVSDRKERKRLLEVCYQIAGRGREAWDIARETTEFLSERTGFDYRTIKWGTKSRLMTVIYGIGWGKQDKFEYWKGFLERLRVRFGIDSFITLNHEERQKIVTAAFYIAHGGRKKKEGFNKSEIIFNMMLEFIKQRFGLMESDFLRDDLKGGMKLSEKIRLMTAGYAVALGREAGLKAFKDTIAAIEDTFGIDAEEMRKKPGEGGLALEEKIRLITAGYEVALGKEPGLKAFKDTIAAIEEIFGIDAEEMKKKPEDGGLALVGKIRLITAAYNVALGREAGLKAFKDTIAAIEEIFGIDAEDMKKKPEDGGLALGGKIRLITAGYEAAKGKEAGLKAFKDTIAAIEEIFGIDAEDMRKKEADGGLALEEKIRLITAAYAVASGKETGLRTFKDTIAAVEEVFGIDAEEMRKKEAEGGLALKEKIRLITAAYEVASGKETGLKTFNDTIAAIKETFGIDAEEMRKKEAEGGLALKEKIRLMTAAYSVASGRETGLTTFKDTIAAIEKIFGIEAEDMKKKETEGGLALEEKIRLITAGYNVALGRETGLKTFNDTIVAIEEIFGIDAEDMRKKETDGKLALEEKINLITAAYHVALGREAGLRTFKDTIAAIEEIFGIDAEDMGKKEAEGGLALKEKIRLITAAYHVALDKEAGLKTFNDTITVIEGIFGIDPEDMKKKEPEGGPALEEKINLITAAYKITLAKNGLKKLVKEGSSYTEEGLIAMSLAKKIPLIIRISSKIIYRGIGKTDNLSGLIGKYLPLEAIKFVYDPVLKKHIAVFKAVNIETDQKEVITLHAERAPPGTFEKYRETGIPEIDKQLAQTLQEIPRKSRFILELNSYGIDGLGTEDMLAIVRPLENNEIALFHELAHSSGIDVTPHINGGEKALDDYINKKGKEHRKVPEMRPHYALRLFQKQKWPVKDGALSKTISILDYVTSEMDEKKRSYILAEEHVHERFGLFVVVFTELEKELHIDVSDRKQRKKLLEVCYQIAGGGREAWHIARETTEFLRERTGFDYRTIKWGTKSRLMTVIYGIGRGKQEKFDYWREFLERLRVRFGITSLVTVDYEERQKIVTAAYYIARGGRKKKEDLNKNETIFNMTLGFIKEKFGLIEGDFLRDRSKGGMELSTKIRLITAGYAVAVGKEAGFKAFKDTIAAIEEIFGIDDEEMRKKEDEGGLALDEKIKLTTAAYEVAIGKEAGLKTFKDTIAAIERTFGIDDEEMRKKEEEGGLALEEKIRLITAAYAVALGKEAGIKVFRDTIAEIEEIFGIDAKDMRKKPEEGGLALEEKIRLITAAYNVARGKEAGLKAFKDTIAAIEGIFGIDAKDMRKKPGQGGLELKEKIRLITAGYNVARGKEAGLKAFRGTIADIEEIFGIDAEEMRKKPGQGGLELKEKIRLITAAYEVALGKEAGLKAFKDTIAAIKRIFGIDAEEMRKKPGQGGLELKEKIRLITAAYEAAKGKEAGLKAFKDTIAAIEGIFGIDAEEMRKKPGQGGLELKEKIRLITAAYAAAIGKESGLRAFKDTIAAIEEMFGINAEEMRKKEAEGGLALGGKIRLITAAYNVALSKEAGLKAFKDTIAAIREIFGINTEDMRKKEEEGGLALREKIRLITAAYHVALVKETGLKVFKDTIATIEETFEIDAEDMRKKPEKGGLALEEKLSLITTAYKIALGRETGLKAFKDTIAAIEETFGIDAEDMRKKPEKGGLALEEKIRLITAAYKVTLAKNGLKKLVKEGLIYPEEVLGVMSLAGKISLIMKISSRIIYSGIHGTEILSGFIGKYQPLEAINFAYDPELEKYVAVFKAVNVETDQKEVITLHAERAPPGTFEKYRETGIPEIDKQLAETLRNIPPDNRFILELNSYGIDGIGTEDMLAIAQPFETNYIALFHELAHSTGIDVTPHINGGEKALDDYINKEGKGHRKAPGMRPHYALRLFQKQEWPEEDKALTDSIKFYRATGTDGSYNFEPGVLRFTDEGYRFGSYDEEGMRDFFRNETRDWPSSVNEIVLQNLKFVTPEVDMQVLSAMIWNKVPFASDKVKEAIREALKNAVVWGNRNRPDSIVVVRWKVEKYRIILDIIDQGLKPIDFSEEQNPPSDIPNEGWIRLRNRTFFVDSLYYGAGLGYRLKLARCIDKAHMHGTIYDFPLLDENGNRIGQILRLKFPAGHGSAYRDIGGERRETMFEDKRKEISDPTGNAGDEAIMAAESLVNVLFNLGMNIDNGEKMLLALDEDLGREGTAGMVRKIIKDISDMKENEELRGILRNLVIIKGRGKALSDRVLRYTEMGSGGVKIKKSNVIMVTKASNEENCVAFMEEALITFVDDSKIDIMGYYPFVEITLFTIAKALYHRGIEAFDRDKMISLYKSLNIEAVDEGRIVTLCIDKKVLRIMLKPAVPFEYDELRDIYKRISKLLQAA